MGDSTLAAMNLVLEHAKELRAGQQVRLAHAIAEAMRDIPHPSWAPIHTAPKMKNILLFAVTDVSDEGRILNWKIDTGCWHSGYEDSAENTPWYWGGHQLKTYDIQPTHWSAVGLPPWNDESLERAAANLWRHENPTESVFNCGPEIKAVYRKRILSEQGLVP